MTCKTLEHACACVCAYARRTLMAHSTQVQRMKAVEGGA